MLGHLSHFPFPGLHLLLAGSRVSRQQGLHCTGHLDEAEGQEVCPAPDTTALVLLTVWGHGVNGGVGRCPYPISDEVRQPPQAIPGNLQVIRQNDNLHILIKLKLLLVEVEATFDTCGEREGRGVGPVSPVMAIPVQPDLTCLLQSSGVMDQANS